MNTLFPIIAIVLASVSALLSIMVVIPLRKSFATPVMWMIKIFPAALAPFFALAGVLSVLLAMVAGPLWVIIPGSFSTIIFLSYLYRVRASMNASTGFEKAFGPAWESLLSRDQKIRFLPKPMTFRLPRIADTEINLIQNIPFCTIPGKKRMLLCDLWEPAKSVKRSGLAFIYFHGSAWVVLDKDCGTRPFFRHLVAQGHVVMDVAYRLYPEIDMTGMLNDVNRAIAWMKTNASVYGVNPDRIVIGGGSAGGHLSLLAAYSRPGFVPEELKRVDLTVQGVISLYGPPDLIKQYYHNGQNSPRQKHAVKENESKPLPLWVQKMLDKDFKRLGMDKTALLDKEPGILPMMLGCYPDDCPEVYASFSPVTHVHKGCPATLIIQGEHDLITPARAAKDLYDRLTRAGVPAALYLIPQTEHAFDLVLPRISPVAHIAFYLVERFLAMQAQGADVTIKQEDTVRVRHSLPQT